ncbi:MAG: hypothetical protein HYS05_20965 [Acidobacteria bacterium]|nr:hypothetical protein [Acidobacteriota bacterium]
MPPKIESPTDVERWFRAQAAGLWPAALGSLSLRKSPCMRDHCAACARGEQHVSYVLYGRIRGRRIAIYVPDELEREIQRALKNGRALQDLLYEAGRRYTNAVKHQRTHAQESEK